MSILPAKPRLGCCRDFSRTNNLLAGWEQRCAIEKCPAIKLYIGELDSLGLERFGELNHLWQAIDVAAVNDKIETKRNSDCADSRSSIQLVLMRPSAGDFVSEIGVSD